MKCGQSEIGQPIADTLQALYDFGYAVYNLKDNPENQLFLANELNKVTKSFSQVVTALDACANSSPIHVPPELVHAIDLGRHPDTWFHEHLDTTTVFASKLALGKSRAIAQFRQILSSALPADLLDGPSKSGQAEVLGVQESASRDTLSSHPDEDVLNITD